MKKWILVFMVAALALLAGCTPPGGSTGGAIDPALVGDWGQTVSLGGALTDYGSGSHLYMGFNFKSNGNLDLITSSDGSSWPDGGKLCTFTASGGSWTTSLGGFGTYSIAGTNMTWVNNSSAQTSYYTMVP